MRISNALRVAVPVLVLTCLGDVSPVEANPPMPNFALHGSACRAKAPEDVKKVAHDHWGVYNASTTLLNYANVTCPMGFLIEQMPLSAEIHAWRDNGGSVTCTFWVTDVGGGTVYTKARQMTSGNPVIFEFSWANPEGLRPLLAYADCQLSPATGVDGKDRAYISSVQLFQ